MYNVVFTALPVLAVAVFDQPLRRDILENNPRAYRESRGRGFRRRGFFGWIVRSLTHSVIIFFAPFWSLNTDLMGGDGYTHGLWYTSTIVYYCVVLVPTLLIIFNMVSITTFHAASVLISLATLLSFTFVASLLIGVNAELYGVINQMYTYPHAWLVIMMSVSIPLLLELLYRAMRLHLRPTFAQILQERVRMKETRQPSYGTSDEESVTKGAEATGRDETTKAQPGGKDKTDKKATADLVSSTEYQGWTGRKNKTSHRFENTSKALEKLEEKEEDIRKRDSETRSSVIRVLLRFRNLTGAQFHSAAQAKNQIHDVVDAKESKET